MATAAAAAQHSASVVWQTILRSLFYEYTSCKFDFVPLGHVVRGKSPFSWVLNSWSGDAWGNDHAWEGNGWGQ